MEYISGFEINILNEDAVRSAVGSTEIDRIVRYLHGIVADWKQMNTAMTSADIATVMEHNAWYVGLQVQVLFTNDTPLNSAVA